MMIGIKEWDLAVLQDKRPAYSPKASNVKPLATSNSTWWLEFSNSSYLVLHAFGWDWNLI